MSGLILYKAVNMVKLIYTHEYDEIIYNDMQ